MNRPFRSCVSLKSGRTERKLPGLHSMLGVATLATSQPSPVFRNRCRRRRNPRLSRTARRQQQSFPPRRSLLDPRQKMRPRRRRCRGSLRSRKITNRFDVFLPPRHFHIFVYYMHSEKHARKLLRGRNGSPAPAIFFPEFAPPGTESVPEEAHRQTPSAGNPDDFRALPAGAVLRNATFRSSFMYH